MAIATQQAQPAGPSRDRCTPAIGRTRSRRTCSATVLAAVVLVLGAPWAQAGTVFRTVGIGPGADTASLQAAIDAVPADNAERRIIVLQPGAFFGHHILDKPHVTLRGSGPSSCITYNLGQAVPGDDGEPITWQGASALLITAGAHDAVIENLTLENTYGTGMQAQACSVIADRVVFRRCRILGWQDTIRLESGRQYFESCYIAGHVDFIYGAATAWFERCEIFCRASGYIVAPATPETAVGFVFNACRVTFPWGRHEVYLGRPWRHSPSATFIDCELGEGIVAEGWRAWNVGPPLVRFAEYRSRGPGARIAGRVDWAIASGEAPPDTLSREAVLGDWIPLNSP